MPIPHSNPHMRPPPKNRRLVRGTTIQERQCKSKVASKTHICSPNTTPSSSYFHDASKFCSWGVLYEDSNWKDVLNDHLKKHESSVNASSEKEPRPRKLYLEAFSVAYARVITTLPWSWGQAMMYAIWNSSRRINTPYPIGEPIQCPKIFMGWSEGYDMVCFTG